MKKNLGEAPMSMTLVIPNAVNIHAHTMKDGRIEFDYEESFTEKQAAEVNTTLEQLVKRTYEMMKHIPMPGIKLKRVKKDTLQISGKVSRTKFGDIMMGEFLSWGTMGNMTLSQMLITMMLNTSGECLRASATLDTTNSTPIDQSSGRRPGIVRD
jgi:hypothetical protein